MRPVEPRGGELAGLIAFSEEFAASVGTDIDQYARAIVLEMNRAHTTGVPLDGGFTQLRSSNLVRDVDGDGDLGDGSCATSTSPSTCSAASSSCTRSRRAATTSSRAGSRSIRTA